MAEIPKRRISSTTGAVVIGIALAIDLAEIGLDFFFDVGAVVNPFVDVGVTFLWTIFLMYSGVSIIGNTKRLMAFTATVVAEFIPDVDGLWTLDVIYTLHTVKVEDAEKAAAAEAEQAEEMMLELQQEEAQQQFTQAEEEQEEEIEEVAEEVEVAEEAAEELAEREQYEEQEKQEELQEAA